MLMYLHWGPLGAPDTQRCTTLLCSLSLRLKECNPALCSHYRHEPTHKGSNYPFPRSWWPQVLDLPCGLLTPLFREAEGQSQRHRRSIQYVPVRTLLMVWLSITRNHRETICSGASQGMREPDWDEKKPVTVHALPLHIVVWLTLRCADFPLSQV